MYNAFKIVFCLFAFFSFLIPCDNILHVYHSFILIFFSSNFRELIDELQAKVQWLNNKFHGHYYHHIFFFSHFYL